MSPRYPLPVLLVAMILATVTFAFAAPPVYVRTIGGPGTAPGQFVLPTGVAVDANGDVYVSDSENCRVTRFHADGTYVTHWNACGGGMGQAMGIAVDDAGTVFVALRHGVLAMFDSQGTPLGQWTHDANGIALVEPWGVEAAGGSVLLVDYGASRILELQAGVLVPIASGAGCGPGQFHSPVSVAHVGDHLYVTEYSDRLQKLTTQGVFAAELGSTSACGQIRGYPRVVCGLGADLLVVVDPVSSTAEIVTTSGALDATWGGTGSGPNQFYGPFDVATDGSGRIYVADAWNQRIQVFDLAPTPARASTWGRIKIQAR